MKSIAALILIFLAGCKSKQTQAPQKPESALAVTTTRGADTIPKTALNQDTLTSLLTNKKVFYYKSPAKAIYKVTVLPSEPMAVSEALTCNETAFSGHDRKLAKISIATAATEQKTLALFFSSLKTDAFMKALNIKPGASSNRVSFEKRNIKLKAVFLYAIKRESDNDYHIIIGSAAGDSFFNVEISGLPAIASASFIQLKGVRKVIEDRFGLPCDPNYRKFTPGLPIEVSGSLFFDVDHNGGTVGPLGLRPKTAWEIHPVTSLVFQ